MGKTIEQIQCHCLKLRKSEQAVRKFYDSYFKSAEVTLGQFFLLKEISEQEGCNIRQLSDRTLLDRSTLARTLKPLFKAKLICDTKEIGTRDSRLTLTEHGREVLRDVYVLWEQAQRAFEEKVGVERIKSYEKILESFAGL